MLLAVVADVHLDASFSWAGSLVGRRLRQAIRDTLRRAAEVSADREVDAFLVAGDLFEDDRYASDTPEFLRGLFEQLSPIPVLLAPGNHDFVNSSSPYLSVKWSPNVHVFVEPELVPFRLDDGITIWAAGHDRPADTPGFFEGGFAAGGAGVHLGLFHGAERGGLRFETAGKLLHAPFDEFQIERAGLSHAFVGHYHHPRSTTLLTYPGNLEHLAFGETGERGLVLAKVTDDGGISVDREVLATTAMHDVKVDVSGCGTVDAVCEQVTAELEALGGGPGVRVARLDVFGEIASDLDLRQSDLSLLRGDLDALTVLPLRLDETVDLEALAKEATVRGAFVRLVRDAAELDDEERTMVTKAGLRALAGRDDLEVV